MKWLRIILLMGLGFGLGGAAVAEGELPLELKARLIADRRAAGPGETVRIGVHLRIPPDAHIYWLNPGEGGLPTQIEWLAPEGFEFGPTQWPVPERFVTPPIVSHGYSGEVLIWTTLRIPEDPTNLAAVRIRARVTWLLCRETCVPGQADLALPLRLGDSINADDEIMELFARFDRRLPREDPAWRFSFEESPAAVTLYVHPPSDWSDEALHSLVFIPFADDLTEPAAEQRWIRHNNAYVLRLPKTARRKAVGERLEGVLRNENGRPPRPDDWFCLVRAERDRLANER